MIPGEAFEIDACNYLNNTYGSDKVSFRRMGGMDSTVSDIAAVINGQTAFFIEAKDTGAQSGQFVLFPDEANRTFNFSNDNKSVRNVFTDAIAEVMKRDFDRFSKVGTADMNIGIDSNVCSQWITGHYAQKNVRFFITKYGESFVIFPLRRFMNYFNIEANYRKKGSGSGSLPICLREELKNHITTLYPSASFRIEGKRLIAAMPAPPSGNIFQYKDLRISFSHINGIDYEIRKLSNLKNPTVVFSIKAKAPQDPNDLSEFVRELK